MANKNTRKVSSMHVVISMVNKNLSSNFEMGHSPNFTCLSLLSAKRKNGLASLSSSSIYDSFVYGELSSVSAVHNKNSVVRIVLASRMVELYDTAVSAHSVMKKYPGLCVAHPDVFDRPFESLVGPKEMLLPGQKFYLVPKTTIEKLRLRQTKRSPIVVPEAVRVKEEDEEEGVCSAKDFYASNAKWSRCNSRKVMKGSLREQEHEQKQKQKKKAFNPPIKKTRRKGVLDGWKPALTPVDEVSP